MYLKPSQLIPNPKMRWEQQKGLLWMLDCRLAIRATHEFNSECTLNEKSFSRNSKTIKNEYHIDWHTWITEVIVSQEQQNQRLVAISNESEVCKITTKQCSALPPQGTNRQSLLIANCYHSLRNWKNVKTMSVSSTESTFIWVILTS